MVSFSFLGDLTMASAVFNSDVTSGVTISMSDGHSDDSTRIVGFTRDVIDIFSFSYCVSFPNRFLSI